MVDGTDKRTKQRRIFAEVREKSSLLALVGDSCRLWRAFK